MSASASTRRRTARAAVGVLAAGMIVLGASACGAGGSGSGSGSDDARASTKPSAAPSTSAPADASGAAGDFSHICGDRVPDGLTAEQADMLSLLDSYKDAMDDEDTARGTKQREELVRGGVAPAYLGTLRDWEKANSADGLFRKPVGGSPQCWDVAAPPAAGGKNLLVLNYHWFENDDTRVMFELDKVGDGGTVFVKITDSPL